MDHPDIAKARAAVEYLEGLKAKTPEEAKENATIVERAKVNFAALVKAIEHPPKEA